MHKMGSVARMAQAPAWSRRTAVNCPEASMVARVRNCGPRELSAILSGVEVLDQRRSLVMAVGRLQAHRGPGRQRGVGHDGGDLAEHRAVIGGELRAGRHRSAVGSPDPGRLSRSSGSDYPGAAARPPDEIARKGNAAAQQPSQRFGTPHTHLDNHYPELAVVWKKEMSARNPSRGAAGGVETGLCRDRHPLRH